ncbi:hypothetical protein IKG16_02425 [Candidatus Saccharibacteria bacterium]|nr:hypothetical protein [Candidatus Saccharibacteria bacterium]
MSKPKHLSIKQITKHQSYYRMFIAGCGAFLIAYVFAGIFTPVQSSEAQEVTINNSASGYYVTITNADTLALNVDATPVGSIATSSDTINVKTNAPTGYQLYVSASSSNIYNPNDTTHTDVHLSPVDGTLENKAALRPNTWGFSLDDASTYELASSDIWAKVLDNGTTLISETSTPEYATGVDTTIYYGVNANTTLPSGAYTTTIYYTATAEGVTTPFMQDFTNAECAAMETDSTMKLMDSRDGKMYNVVKAKDGNCWMADNLAIDNVTISSADSNINSGSFYIPSSSEWSTNDYSQALVHIVTENSTSTISGDAKTPYLGEHYYNWYAATAGASPTTPTSNVTTSICPKGWRLPENSTASGAKSWSNLMSAYSATVSTGADLTTTDESAPQYNLGFHKYYGSWYWRDVTEYNQGNTGYFWSSTPSTETSSYYLRYDATSSIDPQYTNAKYNGFSIRCVFGDSRTLQDITYMQDINTNICQNTAETTSYADAKTLIDNRGKGNAGSATGTYKVIKAKDGNCWMIDNLNLYNYTISATTSDFTSPANYTIPAGITDPTEWNTNNYQTKKVEVAHGLGNSADKNNTYGTWGEVYYNWTVAVAKETTAGVTTAPDTSICPKGWTLPRNGDQSVDKSWAKLLDVYGIDTGAKLLANSTLGVTKYHGNWSWYVESENYQGSGGNFWSGTPLSETGAYALYYNSGGVRPQNNDYKGGGFSIRCVSR